MNDRLHISDADLALYAMGALSTLEMDSTRSHLEVCEQCQEELRQNQIGLAAYAQTTPEIAPPDGAKDRFMAKLATTPQLHAQPQAQPEPVPETTIPDAPQEHLSLWRTFKLFVSANFAGPLAGALAVLLFAVAIDDVKFREALHSERIQAKQSKTDSQQLAQLMELLTAAHAKRVVLHQGSVPSPPEGKVVYDANTGKLLLSATNLQPLPPGKTYELWILQPAGNKPMPGPAPPNLTPLATPQLFLRKRPSASRCRHLA